jgi:hypothetical protein
MTRQALIPAGARRRADYHVAAVPEEARGDSIPPPVGGWNAISPKAAMPPTDALELINVFPQPGFVEIRKGHKAHNICGAAPVESLLVYHAPVPADDKMFAACTSVISNVTVFGTTTASSAVSGLSNARWQSLNLSTSGGSFLWICNGADAPRYYDGSAWATSSISGISGASVVNVALHKTRLWLTRNDSQSPAYLPSGSIQGTATVFDLAGVFKKGGFLMQVASWSLDSGSGPDDIIAFITSRGEVALYTGTDPASDFALKGLYEMGPPIGRRCVQKVGADLLLVCVDGLVPLSQGLVTDRAAAITAAITKKIQPVMAASARSYSDNFGWQIVPYPRGTRAILNVPIVENTQQEQYIMNTVTGSWCRFTGENANVWEVFQDRLFYGGNNGKVYEADCQGFDEGATISLSIKTAFNYTRVKGRVKQFVAARTLLTTDGVISPGIAINVDFADDAVVQVSSAQQDTAAQWDVDDWDAGTWPQTETIKTDWVDLEGEGFCGSIYMAASVRASSTEAESQDLTLEFNGWDVLVIDGAFM